jgi:hypothetical protein
LKKAKVGLITEVAPLSAHQVLADEFQACSHHDIFLNKIMGVDFIWAWSNWMFQGNRGDARKVIMSVHHIDLLKNNIADFKKRESYIDVWHVPCTKTRQQIEIIAEKPVSQIPYWVNSQVFYPINDKNNIRDKYNLPIDKIIFGSFQRDTEGSDLISPKLSKGPDVFADIIIELSISSPVFVILTSWRRQYLMKRFAEHNIPFQYFELADQKTVNELYNALDWYFVTSRFEGGPLAVLQCAQTKTKILSTDVGIAPEILHPECICYSQEDFIVKFKKEKDKTEYNYNAIQKYHPENIIKKYDLLFEDLLGGT